MVLVLLVCSPGLFEAYTLLRFGSTLILCVKKVAESKERRTVANP